MNTFCSIQTRALVLPLSIVYKNSIQLNVPITAGSSGSGRCARASRTSCHRTATAAAGGGQLVGTFMEQSLSRTARSADYVQRFTTASGSNHCAF